MESAVDGLKVARPMTLAVVAVPLSAAIGAIAFFGVQVSRLDAKIDRLDGKIEANTQKLSDKMDALSTRLSEEFRAMRADSAAQTSAIANAITAARQMQPQILVLQPPAAPK